MARQSAILLVLLSAIGFGSMALFANIAYDAGVKPTMLLTLRFLFAAAMLAPLVWLKRLRLPRGRALLGFMVMGVMYTVQAQSFFTALTYASSGLVALLLYVYPVLVTMLALVFGWERLDRRTMALLLLAIAGLAITLGGNLHGQPLGIALGLLSAVIYAVYIALGGRLTLGTDPLAASLVIMLVAGIANGGVALANGASLPQTTTGWLSIGAIGLATVVALTCFLVGIKYIGSARASIISTLEPVITICLGVALLGERVSGTQLVGGAMVLTAVVLLAQRPQKTVGEAVQQAA